MRQHAKTRTRNVEARTHSVVARTHNTEARTHKALTRARRSQVIAKAISGAALAISLAIIIFIVAYITYRGAPHISWEFLTDIPRKRMTEGGIAPAIMGTVWLVALTAIFALPVGISAGVYLSEYAKDNKLTRILRIAIANMAGVPSVIYGLFGYAAFSIGLGLKKSLLAMGLSLAALTLPLIITVTEESLKQLPRELRQASLALGATRWRTTYAVVLPAAAPGIITSVILGLSRAAGETAPILFTGVAFFALNPTSVMKPSMALPYHLYIMATQPTTPAPHIVWGTAFVLVFMLCVISAAAALWRSNRRKKYKWN